MNKIKRVKINGKDSIKDMVNSNQKEIVVDSKDDKGSHKVTKNKKGNRIVVNSKDSNGEVKDNKNYMVIDKTNRVDGKGKVTKNDEISLNDKVKGNGKGNETVVNGKCKISSNETVVRHVYENKNQTPDPSLLPGPTYPALLPKSDMNPSKMKRIPNELIAKALMENNHKISYAAKALNVAHWTLKKRIDKEPELKKLLTVGKEAELDYIENKFMDQVKKDNIAAIIFYLKCQGKHRGWIEKPIEEKTNKPNIIFKYTVVANKQQRKIPNNKVIDMGTIEAE